MGAIFYLAGILLAAASGYYGGDWQIVFVASFIMTVGYFIIRRAQIEALTAGQGVLAPFKLWLIQIFVYSIITAPVYFIASLFR